MLKLFIASDSHNTSCVERFALLTKNCDQAVFLGDVLEDAERIEQLSGKKMLKVAGNCDFFSRCEREIVMTLEGTKLLMVHGDAYGVKYGLDRLACHAAEVGAKAALFGHTHKPFAGYVNGVLLMNPGALQNRCYGMLTLSNGEAVPKLLTL